MVSKACDHYVDPGQGQPIMLGPSSFDGLMPGDTICLLAGNYYKLFIRNIHGEETNPIIIKNSDGQVIINNDSYYGIAFHNCSHIRLLGNGSPDYVYGLAVLGVNHGNGISVDQKSTNVEIGHVEVGHVRLSGIMVKTDPVCADLSSVRDSFELRQTIIHNSYIHNTGNEGVYLGSSYYGGLPLNCDGRDTIVMPHEMIGVHVYNNTFKRTGRNSIQVSSAPEDCLIYNNIVIEDSQNALSFHMNGIQVGGGSRCSVFNNIITDGLGSGIHYFGSGPGMIFNNLIVNPGKKHHPDLPPNQFPVYGINVMHTYTEVHDPIHIFHNTIYNPKTEGVRFSNNLNNGNRVSNNIIINPGGFIHTGMSAFVNVVYPNVCIDVSHNFFDTDAVSIAFSDTVNYDFSLLHTSPAINAAIDLQELGINFDINNQPRPVGLTSDMGAYEYQNIVPDPQQKDTEIIVYPNPATTSIYLIVQNQVGNIEQISIYNMTGKRVLHAHTCYTYLNQAIPVYNLLPGVYHIKVQFDSSFSVGSFIKL